MVYADANGADKRPLNGEFDYYEWCEEMMERYEHSEEFMEDWMHRNETGGEHHGMMHGEAEESISNDGWHGCHWNKFFPFFVLSKWKSYFLFSKCGYTLTKHIRESFSYKQRGKPCGPVAQQG